MNIQKSLFLLFIGVSFFLLNIACNKDTTNNDQTDGADLVLHNGKIYTVNQTQKWAEAIAISEGEIIYVGNDEGVDELLKSKIWAEKWSCQASMMCTNIL